MVWRLVRENLVIASADWSPQFLVVKQARSPEATGARRLENPLAGSNRVRDSSQPQAMLAPQVAWRWDQPAQVFFEPVRQLPIPLRD